VGEVLMKHLTAEPDLSRLSEPPRSAARRALAKDPQRRIRNVSELLSALPQPAAPQVLVNPRATKPRVPEARFVSEPMVVAQVVPEGEEPVMRVLGQGTRALLDLWHDMKIPTPIKVIMLVGIVYLVAAWSPFWLPAASVAAVCYGGYLLLRSIVNPPPPSRHAGRLPPASAVVPVASPAPVMPRPAAPPQVRPARHRALRGGNPFAQPLEPKSSREKLTELLGSMLLSSLVAVAVCVVMALLLEGQPQWNQLAWLALVGTVGSWGVMAPAKLWEGTEGDPMRRRFVMLLVGLGLGLFGYGVDQFLLADPSWGPLALTPGDIDGYKQSLFESSTAEGLKAASLKGYLAYFAFLFPALRWWRQADPWRISRFSIWGTLVCICWAWVLHVAWPFPQPWGVMLAAMIAVSVQLASPWINLDVRRAARLAADR
jgi:hypothetical protein